MHEHTEGSNLDASITEPDPVRRKADECAPLPCAGCRCRILIAEIVEAAFEAERSRLAEIDDKQWQLCFGDEAPSDPAAQRDRIVRVASMRAVLSSMNSPRHNRS